MIIVHCKIDSYDVYVGRPSHFGNQFTVKEFGRGVAVQKFEEYVRGAINFRAWVKSKLKGNEVLGCWCAPRGGVGIDDPLICHGQILARIVRGDYDE